MHDRLRSLDRDDFDACVIGAGFGGLTAAALLAQHGQRVLVIDQHSVPGGNASVFRRRDYVFDVGVHYLGESHPDGLLTRVLHACGITPPPFEPLDPAGFDRIHLPARTVPIPTGRDAFADTLRHHFPHEAPGITRLTRLLAQLEPMAQTLRSPWRLLPLLPRVPLLLRYAPGSAAAFLDTCTHDPELRAVITSQNLTYGLPPARASLLQAMGVLHHYLTGAHYPRGGGQVLSDALADHIEARGGKLLLLARAQRILTERNRAVGVELHSHHLGTRTIRAPWIISNADLKHTLLHLLPPDQLRPKTRARVNGYTMPPGLCVAYLGLRGDLSHLGRANHYVLPQPDVTPCYDACAAGQFPTDPFVFLTSSTLKDPTTPSAPPDRTNLQVMGIAPSDPAAWGVSPAALADGSYRRDPTYQRLKADYARTLLDSARAVIPDIHDRVDFQEVATPLTHTRYTRSTGGTSYGIAATPSQFLHHRPGPTTPLRNLLICGASSRTGTGIIGVALSGVLAAQHALRRNLFRDIID